MFSGTGSPAPRARLAFILAFVSTTSLLPARALAQTEPELPRVFLDTTYSPPTRGKLIAVSAGGDLQAALDASQPGDVIESWRTSPPATCTRARARKSWSCSRS